MHDEPKAGAHAVDDGWRPDSPYTLIHPSGWTITSCIINGKPVWQLLQGDERRGDFRSVETAKRRHVELSSQAAD